MKIIAITSGDPAGIGPEVVGKGMRFYPLSQDTAYIVYGQIELPADYQVINSADELSNSFTDRNKVVRIDDPQQVTRGGQIYYIEISSDIVKKGKPGKESGRIALEILNRCVDDIVRYKFDAILTAPVSKETIRHHHPGFIGHTEFLAEKFSAPHYVMNFTGSKFSLALLTTHCSLKKVSDQITEEFILPKLRLIHEYASKRYPNCRIAMLAMNPHGGEGNIFGTEESILQNAISKLQTENIQIEGPFPADSFFRYKVKDYSQVVAVYHDQGLIPFKLLNGESGVNTTLGLPIIRTSVDHGTAFDIAGKNSASAESFISALDTTEEMLGISDKKNAVYRAFADYYDDYMSHVDWDEWFAFIKKMCTTHLKKYPVTVLDAACGTGLMADKLSRSGCRVTAFDSSTDMLKAAAKKNEDMSLILADFLTPLPVNQYDLVISLFDSVNYLTEKQDIRVFFQNIANSLKQGGLFIFDVSTFFNCTENFDGCVYVHEDEGSFMTVRTEFENDSQMLDIDIFKNNGLFWSQHHESHQLRIYKIKDLIRIISQLPELQTQGYYQLDGFQKVNEKILNDADSQIERLFFVIQKGDCD